MTPEFSKLVDPIFQSVLGLINRIEQKQDDVDLQSEKTEIRMLIDEADKVVGSGSSRIDRENFELAKRGLIYWIDEVLTEADGQWEDIILERGYYGERVRAWKFYVEGELHARHASPDVVETWYLALALGFKGDIVDAFKRDLKRELPGGKSDPDEARRYWAKDLARRIRDSRTPELDAEPLQGDVAPLRGHVRLRIAVVCVVVLLIIAGGLLLYWKWHHNPASSGRIPLAGTHDEAPRHVDEKKARGGSRPLSSQIAVSDAPVAASVRPSLRRLSATAAG
jgi:Type VI secretion system protein DotU